MELIGILVFFVSDRIEAKPIVHETVLPSGIGGRGSLALKQVMRVDDEVIITHFGRAFQYVSVILSGALEPVGMERDPRLGLLCVGLSVIGEKIASYINLIVTIGFIHYN